MVLYRAHLQLVCGCSNRCLLIKSRDRRVPRSAHWQAWGWRCNI